MSKTTEILDRLIGFKSISANSNLDIIDYIQDFLQLRGFEVHRVPDSSGTKAGLYACIGPAGEGVMLSAHTDVVPVDGQTWTKDPFKLTREGDRLYGRGTTDMKGYVASVMALADKASRSNLKEPLKISFSYDEEIGCVGIRNMINDLERTIGRPNACIVGEPTEMQVAAGHKGKSAMRAVCHGQTGHSAIAPQFLNAIYLATDFICELRAIQSDIAANGPRDSAYEVPYTTVHVGKFSGGNTLNVVPDTSLIDFEFRHLVEDCPDDILSRIQSAAKRVVAENQSLFPSAKIDIRQYNSYPGLNVPADTQIVSFGKKISMSDNTIKVPFGTEAGYFSELGIPTVICGPGSMKDQGHKADEFITLTQLSACDAMLDRLLDELAV